MTEAEHKKQTTERNKDNAKITYQFQDTKKGMQKALVDNAVKDAQKAICNLWRTEGLKDHVNSTIPNGVQCESHCCCEWSTGEPMPASDLANYHDGTFMEDLNSQRYDLSQVLPRPPTIVDAVLVYAMHTRHSRVNCVVSTFHPDMLRYVGHTIHP